MFILNVYSQCEFSMWILNVDSQCVFSMCILYVDSLCGFSMCILYVYSLCGFSMCFLSWCPQSPFLLSLWCTIGFNKCILKKFCQLVLITYNDEHIFSVCLCFMFVETLCTQPGTIKLCLLKPPVHNPGQ